MARREDQTAQVLPVPRRRRIAVIADSLPEELRAEMEELGRRSRAQVVVLPRSAVVGPDEDAEEQDASPDEKP